MPIVTNVSRASSLKTDEAPIYERTGREFATHESENHSANEHAR
jgi:hypothetical protein